ncbi:MAG: hypothetical protein ACO1SV_02290 [Fimbriimonas sp.]
MGRREPPSWVFTEWEKMTYGPDRPWDAESLLNPDPKYLAMARSLHARTFIDGQWTVDVGDARLVATQAMFEESEHGNNAEAELRLRELLTHPDTAQLDWMDWLYIQSCLASFEITRGATAQGIERLRQLPPDGTQTMRLIHIRLALSVQLEGRRALPDPLDPLLVDYIREVALMHDGMKGRVAECGDTREALRKLLEEARRRPPARKRKA